MPPTKHMTGNIFAGYLLDAFFNLAGVMTGQSIILIGMMTEGIHTPWLSDRDLALENVRYVRDACGDLAEDFVPRPDGLIVQRARRVLADVAPRRAVDGREPRALDGLRPALREDGPAGEDLGVADVAHVRAHGHDRAPALHDIAAAARCRWNLRRAHAR